MAFAIASVTGVAVSVVMVVIVAVVVSLIRDDDGVGDGGPATSATVSPRDVAIDAAGNLYIVDSESRGIRKVTPGGVISTIAADEVRSDGSFAFPSHVAVDGEGNALFSGGVGVRRMAVNGITTVAGTADADYLVDDFVMDAAGNLYFIDFNANGSHVWRVSGAGDVSTVDLAGPRRNCFDGKVGPVTPVALAVDEHGNLYVADDEGCQALKVDADGTITVVAGSGGRGPSGDGGRAVDAAIVPSELAVDQGGNVYITDHFSHRVRRVSPDGIISTVAGNGSDAFSGDGGKAVDAGMNPWGIAVDGAGNLYIADLNNRVRKVSADGIVSTVAGDGSFHRTDCDC